jgi:hypothetical protein
MFIGETVNVTLEGIEWAPKENITNGTTVFYETYVNGVIQASGNYSLADVGRELPTSGFAGTVKSDVKGTTSITVVLTLDGAESDTGGEYNTYAKGVAIVPLIIVLLLAMTTRMVEFSLFTGVFVGACIINGNLNEGFKRTLDKYILEALADVDHVYVILFTLFLSGLVGMMVSCFTVKNGRLASSILVDILTQLSSSCCTSSSPTTAKVWWYDWIHQGYWQDCQDTSLGSDCLLSCGTLHLL